MLNKNEALKFISDNQENGVKIFGVERFVEVIEGYVPDIDGIADFSELSCEESHAAARDFINIFDDGLFEFVL